MTIPRIMPNCLKWAEVENFEDFDTRRSAIDCIFANIVSVNDGEVEWCPHDPEDEFEYYAWLWLVRPSMGNDLKRVCGNELAKLIEAYNKNQMEQWFESV